MRILIPGNHRFPAETAKGSGRRPKAFPSGSGYHLLDLTVQGLTELGHEVVYLLPKGWDYELPSPVHMVREPDFAVDAAHVLAYVNETFHDELKARSLPTVVSCHRDPHVEGRERGPVGDNWVYVSKTLADAFGSGRYVLNGLDPQNYTFSSDGGSYLLFMAALEWAEPKGLSIALSVAEEAGMKLVVAGTGLTEEIIEHVAGQCRQHGAEYVGDVRGPEKAELFAGAKAFFFPTQIAEAFGLCIVEALMSGKPVISSANGASPEIVSPEVGFICHSRSDYLEAIEACDGISARVCRDYAVSRFHYQRMAAEYVREYEREIAGTRPR
ncbi:MAG: glycosyltransferase [Pseudomonadota bacterium]